MTDWTTRILRFAHRAVIVLAIISILASLSGFLGLIVYSDRVEKYTLGLRPAQFLGFDENSVLANHTDIFGVGHNSGDTIATAVQALVHGAEVIEIDVVLSDGQLYAGHSTPNRIFGQTSFRGSPLQNAWVVASAAGAIQLDLKGTSAAYIDRVGDFLASRQRYPTLVLSSPDVATLTALSARAPEAILLLSVGSQGRYNALQNEPDTIAAIDGVTIREDLVTEETANWLHNADLLIWAWTVNQPQRAAELATLGIDALSTDNLAILDALAGNASSEPTIERRSALSEEPGEENPEANS